MNRLRNLAYFLRFFGAFVSVWIEDRMPRLAGGFFTMAFVHFAWIGAAKWGLLIVSLSLTVDMLGMSGFWASVVIQPTIMVINWVVLQHFLLGGNAGSVPESAA